MREFEISWSEISLQELNNLVEQLQGVAEVDGDAKTIRVTYRGVDYEV